MRWSLSEFLNLVELRSQAWCYLDLYGPSGLGIPHSEAIYFYLVLEGSAKLSGAGEESLLLRRGDIAIILSGETHALRSTDKAKAENLSFLTDGGYADTPPRFSLGAGRVSTRILASRLKVRWPGGQHPRNIPATLTATTKNTVVNWEALLEKASGGGAMAVLTRASNLIFVDAFRDHPQCRAAFRDFGLHDSISRAQQYIEMHPFNDWSVLDIAAKVGMGRSSFAARFTKEIGMTPMAFITEERMKHSAVFLQKTDMKLAEICEKIGYKSEAAFIRRFTASHGMTPGEMRRRSRIQNSRR